MKTFSNIYNSKYGKDPENRLSAVEHPIVSVQRPSDEDILKRKTAGILEINRCQDEIWPLRRKVSESIKVPQSLRPSQDPTTMSDLMAAMVLSNFSSSPVLHNYIKGASPRSYDSSGVESWGQDSQRTSPFHRPLSANHFSDGALKREFDDTGSDVSNSDCVKPRTLDEVSEMDPGTILLQSPASTPNKQNTTDSSDGCDDDEPQDFTMKTLVAKEAAEKRKEIERKEKEKNDKTKEEAKILFEHSPANLGVPPTYPIIPHFSLPYYFQSPFLGRPFPSSVPNELLLHLTAGSPASLRSVDNTLGYSMPSQFNGKFHPYSRRSVPTHKIGDDSAFSSPLRCVSPSKLALGSAPASFYRLPNSSPNSGSDLSFSPSRVRKRSKSPLTMKYPARSAFSNISLPTDGSGLGLPRETQRAPFEHPLPHQMGSWKRDYHFAHFPNQIHFGQKQQQILFPPTSNPSLSKSLPLTVGRKVPGDGKKCRKVYGMDNKDLWCTACRWKKACQRFLD